MRFAMDRLICLLALLLIMGCTESAPLGPLLDEWEPPNKVNEDLKKEAIEAKVDILFIVDNSGSMSSAQTSLAQNASLFINEIFSAKFIDYHIGVTTSDRGSFGNGSGGSLVTYFGETFVSRDTMNGPAVLSSMFRVGTSGSAIEHFLSIIDLFFSDEMLDGPNFGFFRKDAHLAIFVVTDTGDQSDFTAREIFDTLKRLKRSDEEKLHFAAALAKQAPGCNGEWETPTKLEALVDFHKERGYKYDMCSKEYGKSMGQVARALVRAASTFFLSEWPDIKTIEVTYGDQIIPNDPETGWVYDADRNAVVISPEIEIDLESEAQLNVQFESIFKDTK